jgi:hypothetical protein
MWHLTKDVEAYAARAWDLLAADPEASTVGLTIIESVRAGRTYGEITPTYGWLELGDGSVAGAVAITPPWPLLLSVVPEHSLDELASTLRAGGVPVDEVHGTTATTALFASAWTAGTSLRAEDVSWQRLYRLGELIVPSMTPGTAWVAGEADFELVLDWYGAFSMETGAHSEDHTQAVRMLIEDGTLSLWEDCGEVVSMAGRRKAVAGVARVGPVYTPDAKRSHGYGAAVTAACSQAAIDDGATSVVLFTDLANPISNSIYQAIGYLPVSDRLVVRFVSYEGA